MFSSLKTITPRETAESIDAVFQTSLGAFTVRLFHKRVPQTCQNFIDLAEGTTEWTHPRTGATRTDAPYYDGLVFHRIIDSFMIQGGCPAGDGRGGPGYKFADEFHGDLQHVSKGILSMANAGRNTNGSQFFITLGATPHLDNRHAVFGEVTEGMDVIDAIGNVRTDAMDKPLEPVVMETVSIVRNG